MKQRIPDHSPMYRDEQYFYTWCLDPVTKRFDIAKIGIIDGRQTLLAGEAIGFPTKGRALKYLRLFAHNRRLICVRTEATKKAPATRQRRLGA